jgi:hypothetical protein
MDSTLQRIAQRLRGQTCNPHDTTRIPGGSSGGSAAAVAVNLAMCGLGTDIRLVRFHHRAAAWSAWFRPKGW